MAAHSGDVEQFRAAVIQELERLHEDMLWTEKAHFAHAESQARANLWLGLGATVAAAIAAATVVAQTMPPIVPGIAALVAAIGSGVSTFLKPKETAKRHLDAGRQLNALRVRVRQALKLDLAPATPPDPAGWRAFAASIAAEKARIEEETPGTSGMAFRRARKKIEAGEFEHAVDVEPS